MNLTLHGHAFFFSPSDVERCYLAIRPGVVIVWLNWRITFALHLPFLKNVWWNQTEFVGKKIAKKYGNGLITRSAKRKGIQKRKKSGNNTWITYLVHTKSTNKMNFHNTLSLQENLRIYCVICSINLAMTLLDTTVRHNNARARVSNTFCHNAKTYFTNTERKWDNSWFAL